MEFADSVGVCVAGEKWAQYENLGWKSFARNERIFIEMCDRDFFVNSFLFVYTQSFF